MHNRAHNLSAVLQSFFLSPLHHLQLLLLPLPAAAALPGPGTPGALEDSHPPFTTFLAVRRSSILHFYSCLPAILQLVWAAHSVRGVRDEPFPLLIFLPHGSAAVPEAARTGIAGR